MHPYPLCPRALVACAALVGRSLGAGWRRTVLEVGGGTAGCTHLTELAQILPTAAVQAYAGEVIPVQGDDDVKPFQLDHCHALRTDGGAVAKFYPRWAVAHADDSTT